MKFFNIINGEKRSSEQFHQVTDPRTEEPLWDVPVATTKDLDEAVEVAQKALKTWGKSTLAERSEALRKMAEAFQANKEELYEILMKETGKSASF
jgi:acyl-CoA reductase-like NAD-dependent aldehyde dehydrogenase